MSSLIVAKFLRLIYGEEINQIPKLPFQTSERDFLILRNSFTQFPICPNGNCSLLHLPLPRIFTSPNHCRFLSETLLVNSLEISKDAIVAKHPLTKGAPPMKKMFSFGHCSNYLSPRNFFATPPWFCWQITFYRPLPTSGRNNTDKNVSPTPLIHIFWTVSA